MAEPDGYLLSAKDYKLFKEMVYTFQRLQHFTNAFGRPPDGKIDHEEMHTSEIYIARVPEGGIPALQDFSSSGEGHIPGSALCQIFKTSQSTETTESVEGFFEKIYNLTLDEIPEFTWIVVFRDKYGKWYLVPTATEEVVTGCRTACGTFIGIRGDACLSLSLVCAVGGFSNINTAQFDGVYAFGDNGVWAFEEWDEVEEEWIPFIMDWGGGTGQPILTFETDGTPVLSVGALELKLACLGDDATFIGGLRNGFVPDLGTGSSLEDEPECTRHDFVLRVACVPCAVTEVIEAACCLDGLLPSRLYMNFFGGTGSCTCLNGLTLIIDYIGSGSWNNLGGGEHPCSAGGQIADLSCFDGEWHVSYGAPGGCFSNAVITAGPCNVNEITSGTLDVSESGPGDCCVGTIDFSITKAPEF